MKIIYRILEYPFFYRMAGFILAPGAINCLSRLIKNKLSYFKTQGLLLDVGCGPSSHLFQHGLFPVGIDLLPGYIKRYREICRNASVASADSLPFKTGIFDGVWSIGLLHHLPDEVAKRTVGEMLRVVKLCGYVIIFDAVSPKSNWRRPIPALIRSMDRGRFVRSQESFVKLLPDENKWRVERKTYAVNGLEILIAVYDRKTAI